jgi:hypothetical protein
VEGRVGLELGEARREEDLGGAEDLGHADGGDGEDEARRGEEAGDDRGVDQPPRERGGEQPQGRGDEVGQVVAGHQHDGGGGGEPPDLGLGQVDDPARPVQQHEAHRDEGLERPEDDTQHHDAEGEAVGQEGTRRDERRAGGQRRPQPKHPGGVPGGPHSCRRS